MFYNLIKLVLSHALTNTANQKAGKPFHIRQFTLVSRRSSRLAATTNFSRQKAASARQAFLIQLSSVDGKRFKMNDEPNVSENKFLLSTAKSIRKT